MIHDRSGNSVTAPKSPPPASWRWLVLVIVSIAMFGNYYVYDSVAPVADALQRLLGFSDTQLGTLNAIYSLPNVGMVLLGGVIVDRLGARATIVAFTTICAFGAALTALSPMFSVGPILGWGPVDIDTRFPMMAAGRLIFGLGAESMIIAISVAIGQWFFGRALGLAFGLNLSLARAGSFAADRSPSWAGPLYDSGWQQPLWLAAGIMAGCVAVVIVYYLMDKVAARRFELPAAKASDRFVWAELWRFDRSFWYITGLCVTFYAVILPFRSTYAIKYFQHAHRLSLEEAGAMNGWVFFAAIFATPTFGWLADKIGHRSALMAFGTLLLFTVFPILAYTDANLWIATVLIGVAFSLVPGVMWPAVPYIATARRMGTAFGLMFMLQNIGMMLVNIFAGMLNDRASASAENPAGYTHMLWLFATLSLFGLVFAWLLYQRERGPHGHGLETIRA
jgi:MFS family permease